DQLGRARYRHVVLAVGYMAEAVERCIGPHHGAMEVSYSRESRPLGTGGAARLAAERVRSETILVMNGDSYCHVDLPTMARYHHENGGPNTLAVVEVPDASRYGTVEFDDARRVIGFREKKGTAEPGWVNAGVYLLGLDLLRSIALETPVSLERETFPAWAG